MGSFRSFSYYFFCNFFLCGTFLGLLPFSKSSFPKNIFFKIFAAPMKNKFWNFGSASCMGNDMELALLAVVEGYAFQENRLKVLESCSEDIVMALAKIKTELRCMLSLCSCILGSSCHSFSLHILTFSIMVYGFASLCSLGFG